MTSPRRQAAARRRNPEKPPGPPPSGGPDFLLVGILRRPHGVRGEMLMAILTDFPERLTPATTLYIGEDHIPHTLASRRHHNDGFLVRFEGHTRREDVETWSNTNVYVSAADRPPLPEGEYYLHQLLGLRVLTTEGAELGRLTDALETGANLVYVVRTPENKEILLPAIEDVIRNIDLASGTMTIHLLEGLV